NGSLSVDTEKLRSALSSNADAVASLFSTDKGEGVADRILAAAVAKGVVQQSELNVVWTSPDIPESPMVWRKDLDPALKQKIAAAFAGIKDVKWGDQGVLNGFVPTTDGAYDVVRETAKILNLDLKA
ncbi:PhnD/SsuA/transferrin family substrate-binding protein, partial [Marinobacter sp.]|uniref:PhnD/SsuA/transferrin family substrate-binding protein n=1 Tax=Marinobacter sp. TaxID=50741 RepID=UPI0035C6B207